MFLVQSPFLASLTSAPLCMSTHSLETVAVSVSITSQPGGGNEHSVTVLQVC